MQCCGDEMDHRLDSYFCWGSDALSIVSLSSGVPTLIFVYNVKSKGINRKIFGHTDYCPEPKNLDVEADSSGKSSMLDDTTAIRRDLTERILEVERAALNAENVLKQLIGEN